MAFSYVLARPDLFLLRTFNRARAYFGFPIHRGEPLEKYVPTSPARRLLGAAITIVDACFYWPIMTLALLFIFGVRGWRAQTDYMTAILGAALLYAIPYWVSFSQPRFNFPVVPLFGVLAAVFLDSLLKRPEGDPVAHVYSLVKQRRGAQIALALFFYIQIEWLLMGYSIV